jgi:hypothetical protein
MSDNIESFEYDITRHSAESLGELVFVCTETGECGPSKAAAPESNGIMNVLNDRGSQGWELVQIMTGSTEIAAVWKRKKHSPG